MTMQKRQQIRRRTLLELRRAAAGPRAAAAARTGTTKLQRLTDVAGGRVAIVLCGVCRDATGPWAVVALASHPDGLVRSRIEPLAEVSFGALGVRAG